MTALDVYRSVLEEIDKDESPSFSPLQFNSFINRTIDEYITENYGKGEIFQKTLDDISEVMVDDAVLVIDGGDSTLFEKPEDYRHFLYANVTVKVIADYRKWKANDQITLVVKRQRTNRRGYQEENAYQRPSEYNPGYRISNGKLKFLVGSRFTPLSAKLSYIKIPDTVYLNPDDSADFDDPVNNTVMQFPSYVCKELIHWCARIFLENIESRRYQTAITEQQLRNE